MNDLEWQPGRLLVDEVSPLDPQARPARIEPDAMVARQSVEIGQPVLTPEIVERSEAERQAHIFGMPGFDRFHQPGSPRSRSIASLAMKHRTRPRIRAAHHDHVDADAIEAGQVGDPGNAEHVHQPPNLGKRILRRHRAVSAGEMNLAAPGIVRMRNVASPWYDLFCSASALF